MLEDFVALAIQSAQTRLRPDLYAVLGLTDTDVSRRSVVARGLASEITCECGGVPPSTPSVGLGRMKPARLC